MDIAKEIIYPAMDEIAQTIQSDNEFNKSSETLLFGAMSALDSLAFVSFIVAVEERIFEKCGVQVSLVDEKAMSLKNSPFRTIGTLTEYIEEIVKHA